MSNCVELYRYFDALGQLNSSLSITITFRRLEQKKMKQIQTPLEQKKKLQNHPI
jgi:hypothetical protein